LGREFSTLSKFVSLLVLNTICVNELKALFDQV
jgi:hypothetical protein